MSGGKKKPRERPPVDTTPLSIPGGADIAGLGRERLAHGLALTAELGAVIVGLVSGGATIKEAANLCGLSDRTIRKWCQWGLDEMHEAEEAIERNDDPRPPTRFMVFAREMLWARAHACASLRQRIVYAGAVDPKLWQANAYLLERMEPQEYASHAVAVASAVVEINGTIVDPGDLLLEQLAEAEKRIALAVAGGPAANVASEDDGEEAA